MGRKVHPTGFRTGIIRDWQARWYADKSYGDFLSEDIAIRQAIRSRYAEAGVSLVEIERQMKEVAVTVHTARPGVVIGRGGQRVDEMRLYLEELIGKKVRLNIQEIRQPELDAYLVARMIAEQIERRIAYRRVMKQTIFRTIQAGAKGVRVSCAGRLGGAEIARRQTMHQGRVPLHTLRADIDYGFTEACTTLGRVGVKVWIYKGDILPEAPEVEIAGVPPKLAEAGEEPVVVAEADEEPVVIAEASEEVVVVAEADEEPVVIAEASEEVVAEAVAPEEPAEVEKAPEATDSVDLEEEPPVSEEKEDATAQAGEVPQDS